MQRSFLEKGGILRLQDTEYTIEDVCGAGSNAVVYRAVYRDNLHPDQLHRVLIKELFPQDNAGLVFRDASGRIRYEGAEELFALHKKSFLHGNSAHLSLLLRETDAVGGNINSFEANNTCYTVLPYYAAKTLEQRMASFPSLPEKAELIVRLLDALHSFHRNRMLHLDISPDNILLIEREESIRRETSVLLIDYNSVWNLEELSGHEGIYYSLKPHYSSPEVRLQDRRSIGPQSDLYSVSAVFFEIVTGRPVEQDDVYKGLRGEADKAICDAVEGYPQSVVYKLRQILRKGLCLMPSRRYQSCAEMLADVEDLRRRIERRGVTGSSLWECARSKARRFIPVCRDTQIIPNEILAPSGETEDALRYAASVCTKGQNLWLYGDAGFGKTTLLYRLAAAYMRQYREKAPVYHYLSLSGYNDPDNPNYIRDALTIGIRADDSSRTVEDTRKALDALLSAGEIAVIVLLDGFNEIHADTQALVREINALSRYPGCSFLITSRSGDADQIGLAAFTSARLCPLPTEKVCDYLTRKGLQIPSQETILSLLTNPMMLQMYARSLQIRREAGEAGSASAYEPQDGGTLIRGYLESLELSETQHCAGDKADMARIPYLLRFFLPLLAETMRADRNRMSKEDLLAFAEENFGLLQSRAFSHAFPAFAGKSREILSGVQTGAEWFDLSVREILVKRLQLLHAEEGEYGFAHDLLRQTLAQDGAALTKLMRRYKARRRVPKLAAVVLAVLAVIGTVLTLWSTKVWPDKADALAAQAKQSIAQHDYRTAAETALEGLQKIVHPKESDAAVVQLRSAVIAEGLRGSNAQIHAAYSMTFPNKDIVLYGYSPDGRKAIFGDTAQYWVCDPQTGKLLETYQAGRQEQDVRKLLGKQADEELIGLGIPAVLHEGGTKTHTVDIRPEKSGYTLTFDAGSPQAWTVHTAVEPAYVLNADKSVAAVQTSDYEVMVYCFRNGYAESASVMLGHTITDLAISPKGNYLFVFDRMDVLEDERRCKVFDMSAGGQRVMTLEDTNASAFASGFIFPDAGDPCFFTSDEGVVTKYSFLDKTPAAGQHFVLTDAYCSDLQISDDGSMAVAIGYDVFGKDHFVFFDPQTGEMIRSFQFSAEKDNHYSIDRAQMRYFCHGQGELLELYDVRQYKPLCSVPVEGSTVRDVWVDRGGARMLCALESGEVFYLYRENGVFSADRLTFPRQIMNVMGLGVAEDMLWVGAFCTDGDCTFVFDAQTHALLRELPDAAFGGQGIFACGHEICTDGLAHLAQAPEDTLFLYDLAGGKPLEIDTSNNFDWAFSPENRLLAYRDIYSSVQNSTQIHVVRLLEDGSAKVLYAHNPDRDADYAFDESGRFLVVNTDKASTVLDAQSGDVLMQIPDVRLCLRGGRLWQTNGLRAYPDALPSAPWVALQDVREQAKETFQ